MDAEALLSSCYLKVIGCVLAVIVLVGIAIGVLWRIRKSRQEKKRKDYPKDTVVLHQIGRAKYAPSLSPFPLKLETYLRMAGIPYINEHSMEMSSKGKTPWMTYNGLDIADSEFCIGYLTEKLGTDMSKNLTPEEKAIAHAFQKMTEENLYW
ncbi:PREDICTED: failed axon connections homolog [Priapulus caudatus]|uniref:Failed axon connections homolog n=1 Tax=Priapulus caudatus TaxID=37621 RepID=A0ABM1EWZ1_PRICU|nr:PREDICTED: failed axon connections homolog [Priapulus caudatus]